MKMIPLPGLKTSILFLSILFSSQVFSQNSKTMDSISPKSTNDDNNNASPLTDIDGDNIPDQIDLCPKIKGDIKCYGCPKESEDYYWDYFEYRNEASAILVVTPATYDTIVEQILVKPAHKEGATFTHKSVRKLKKEASSRLEVVGEIDTLKGEIMFDEIGRKMHKLTTYQNLKQPQSTREIAIPAEYKEIERYFVDKEGRGPKVEDEYLNFEKFVLKTPASIKEEIMVPRRNIVKIRRSGKLNDAFSKLQPVDQTPSFPGGIKALSNFFKDTYYPIEAYQNNTQGLVILDFTVDKSGDVKDFRIIKDLDGGCGEEALRRAEIMPKWKPAMLDGNPVDYPQLLKVYFKKDDYYIYGSTEASSETERKVDTDFSIPKPNFPGGVTALNSYIKSNLLYPKKALTNKIEGAVLIEFIVNSDGTVEDVEVVKDIGSKCGEAAKQMVEGMPAWEPAKYNGTPIASSYQLFVDFYASKYPKRKPVFPSVIIEKSKKEISSELFKTHQSLAILLPEVNLTDKRMIKAKSEKILEKESKLKIEVHQNLYEQLTKFIDKGKIKGIDIQDIEKNKQILSQKNEALEYAEIAKQLGVDAILTLTAAIEEQMNTVKTKNSGGTHRKTSPLNAYNVIFRLYDGSTGELIWEEKKSDEEEFVNIKHTKIIGGIFKDVLNNTFPYSEN